MATDYLALGPSLRPAGTCGANVDHSACPNGNGDCLSGVCSGAVCQPASCTDGVQNGNETGVDCGGSCKACPPPTGGQPPITLSGGAFTVTLKGQETRVYRLDP
jgi:hypothetical protein